LVRYYKFSFFFSIQKNIYTQKQENSIPIAMSISGKKVVLDLNDLEKAVAKIEKEVRSVLEGMVPTAKTKREKELSMYM